MSLSLTENQRLHLIEIIATKWKKPYLCADILENGSVYIERIAAMCDFLVVLESYQYGMGIPSRQHFYVTIDCSIFYSEIRKRTSFLS